VTAPPRNSFSYALSPREQSALTRILREGNYRPIPVEHTQIAAETEDCKIALYKSGKCLVQGKAAADFVTFVLEPLVLQRVGLGYEEVLDPNAFQPHIGVDESGKGDFFGPLVIAAAYADRDLTRAMQEMGVRDSKTIASDKRIFEISGQLRRLLGRRFSTVRIGPAAYNRLYARMRNINSILAWGHARAIENLLDAVPGCPRAVSDQFGSKWQVERALMKKGRGLTLVQRHRAESDLAVAAASILARSTFLGALRTLADQYRVPCPKGVSSAVQDCAAELIRKHGPRILLETSKCHFKTTDEVLRKTGHRRADLGPEGQAVSKPPSGGRWHRREEADAAQPASEPPSESPVAQ
jgi:ribonuclease HIII